MRILLALGMAGLPLMASTVDDFRWKKRLLVVTGTDADVERKLAKEEEGLQQRDIVIFFLEETRGHHQQPDAKLVHELIKRLKIKEGVAEVVLLGKDGQTTLRWKAEEFSTKALFQKIDVMPMRRREMKDDDG